MKHDRTETVDNNETITIQGHRTETVDKDETITIDGNRTETVDKDETITIHATDRTSIGRAHHHRRTAFHHDSKDDTLSVTRPDLHYCREIDHPDLWTEHHQARSQRDYDQWRSNRHRRTDCGEHDVVMTKINADAMLPSTAVSRRSTEMPAAASIASQISSVAELGDEARALLKDDPAPQAVPESAHGERTFSGRGSLSGACSAEAGGGMVGLGLRPPVRGRGASADDQGSLDATEKWIAQPTEENRRAAMSAAEAADVGTAAGCAGVAAFFSGGSLAPPEVASFRPARISPRRPSRAVSWQPSPPNRKRPPKLSRVSGSGSERGEPH